jgi:hypothetical protein
MRENKNSKARGFLSRAFFVTQSAFQSLFFGKSKPSQAAALQAVRRESPRANPQAFPSPTVNVLLSLVPFKIINRFNSIK